jgi:tRNA A-37 threonylcarbamoyl transferase component Bud32
MGVVYRARELAMNRDVAVKFLRNHYSAESAVGRRFIEEARITGQLQHPGIPPVHQVGTLPDGRPFLAMKLIKGKTLADLLAGRKDPAEDRGRFLAVFEQVAQAVGYAHSRSVIHRDLKPANVMVGSFGEVQVMDWGLAKVLGAGELHDPGVDDGSLATEIRSLRGGAEATQAGSLLGTPAFMPPEQAIGAVGEITERSDVFGLGAVLCVILTGQPPFVSEGAESTRLLAARAKLEDAFARLEGCSAEPELIVLAKRCLAAAPADRPRTGGEVAEAISTLRADAERRARLAEMDRARTEVRSAEERKRRRVQRALAMAVLTLVAVAGVAAWWVDSVRAERRADQLSQLAEREKHEAELLARQLTTERDVVAALNEVQVLRKEGLNQADDPPRWALTLTAAFSALKRAEALLVTGETTEGLRARVAAARADLARDERDRTLLAELDRIEVENDARFLIPVAITGRHAEKYEAAFRTYGVDPVALPTAEAVAWLRTHRFRSRLITALRGWERARPLTDIVGGHIEISLHATVHASAAVAGEAAVQANLTRPGVRGRMKAILDAVTEDGFSRDWYSALARNDFPAINQLLHGPEFNRLSSRDLSSLVDGLLNSTVLYEHQGLLSEILTSAYQRFPGEYWVNFRLGSQGVMGRAKEDKAKAMNDSIRFLSAAVAARPRSAMARLALGITMVEGKTNGADGKRLIRGAIELDPTSAWPHLFLAFSAAENSEWKELFAELKEAVRFDPDVSFLMTQSIDMLVGQERSSAGSEVPSRADFARLYNEMIAMQPDHPGGYCLRASGHQNEGEYRLALADYRKAKALFKPDDAMKAMALLQLNSLEAMARWEEKLPAVLRGEIKPGNVTELIELAQYSAGFEKRFALAARFATEASKTYPSQFHAVWTNAPQYAGWAVRAACGLGADAAGLSDEERSRLHTTARAWLREASRQAGAANKNLSEYLAKMIRAEPGLAAVRDPESLAKLPPDERVEWKRFWDELPQKDKELPTAPAPRERKP